MQPIEFRAMSKRLSLHLESQVPFFDNYGIAHMTPAKVVTFQEGRFTTSDEKIANLIRESEAFKVHEIVEITEADKDLFKPESQKTVRGAISAINLHQEAGNAEKVATLTLNKNVAICDFPGCTKEYSGVRAKQALSLHKVSHRKALRVEAK